MITIIFSTHNGSKTLPTMLEAIKKLSWSFDELKIIAVDNASTDNTVNILNSYVSQLPLQVISCPERGKNKALNTALPLIEGELVIFTDDDVIPKEDWLIQLTSAANQQQEYDIFGGKISPQWPYEPPKWILESVPLGMTFAITDENLPKGPIDPGSIWGPNMMCRSQIFFNGNRFNENVGPSQGNYIMGSETEFTIRMSQLGSKCYFVPTAEVKHIIRENQLTRKWLLNRSLRSGKSNFLKHRHHSSFTNSKQTFGLPRWMLIQGITNYFKSILHGSWIGTEKSFRYQWKFYQFLGYFIQSRHSKFHE